MPLTTKPAITQQLVGEWKFSKLLNEMELLDSMVIDESDIQDFFDFEYDDIELLMQGTLKWEQDGSFAHGMYMDLTIHHPDETVVLRFYFTMKGNWKIVEESHELIEEIAGATCICMDEFTEEQCSDDCDITDYLESIEGETEHNLITKISEKRLEMRQSHSSVTVTLEAV